MNYYTRLKGHFCTITKHKILVMNACFKCHLYKQGIFHDLSKYSLTEFCLGVKYYEGFRSPIDKEKEINSISIAWLHHKGNNKHHWEYWIDRKGKELYVNQIPLKYIKESVCDRIVASKIYQKQNYTDASAFNFYMNGSDQHHISEVNKKQMYDMLSYIKDYGEKQGFKMIKDYH